MNKPIRIRGWNLLMSFGIAIILIIFLFPVFWILLSSFKQPVDIFSNNFILFFQPTLQHYKEILVAKEFSLYVLNSLIIGISTTVIVVALASPAAYSLARFRFSGSKAIGFWILSQRMFPPIVTAIPFFLIMRTFHLLNTHAAVIIAHTTFNLPLAIWLLREFYREIPEELEAAALVDGASRWGAFVKIVVPLSTPGLAATAILCFIFSWNEFLFALILTDTIEVQTLPVGVAALVGVHVVDWGAIFAAGGFSAIPLFIFAFFVQKHIVKGLTLGAIKG